MDDIIVPQLEKEVNIRTWFKLDGGIVYKNIGFSAEVGYSADLNAPSRLKGELLVQGETTDPNRGQAYILQSGFSSFRFKMVG